MCAINGFNWKDEELILKMNKATAHRGPDGTGVFSHPEITLGHNRLSIIDLSHGADQPMKSADGELVIVFNGEIYNYRELKNELPDYHYKTESDTEVILAAYKKWGPESFSKLNGMFAFALWDEAKKELYLVRDPVGIKPLYYSLNNKKLIFSSEICGILEHGVDRKLNVDALNAYLRILYVPAPETPFLSIRKIMPGSYGLLKDGDFSIQQYWRMPHIEVGKTIDDDQVREAVFEAVDRQLVSDRPIGVYLSGGLDSTTILSAMKNSRDKVDSFSVGFSLSEKDEEEKFNHDFKIAKMVAEHFGARHHELVITPHDVAQNLETILSSIDSPISNPTAIPMYLLAQFTKQTATVVLSGEGGDEIFGGYDRYRYGRAAELYQKIPFTDVFSDTEWFKKLETKKGIDQFVRFMFQKEKAVSPLLSQNYLKSERYIKGKFKEKLGHIEGSAADYLMRADFESWLPDQALSLADSMSMRSALEQRVPLLDLELVELLSPISATEKISLFKNKVILRDAMAGDLPEFLFKEPKRGWFSPGAKWLREEKITALARQILSKEYYAGTANLFNWSEVETMLENHLTKSVYNLNLLWAILVFQIWARKYNLEL